MKHYWGYRAAGRHFEVRKFAHDGNKSTPTDEAMLYQTFQEAEDACRDMNRRLAMQQK